MQEQKVNPDQISKEGIRRLLSFLPFFDDDEANYGTGPHAAPVENGAVTILQSVLSAKASEFVTACYEEHFVQSFDWGEWCKRREHDLSSEAFIAKADLTVIIKMLTAHIRADRFCDGHLLLVMKDGTIRRILKRLRDVHSGQESERCANKPRRSC